MRIFSIKLLCALVFMWGVSSLFAQSETEWGNKGTLYQNPGVSEKKSRPQPEPVQTIVPATPATKPIKAITTPKPVKRYVPIRKRPKIQQVTQPAAKETITTTTEEEPLQAEQADTADVAALKAKLASALTKLAAANQKIKELESQPSAKKSTQTYMVQKKDNLWNIAKKKEIYGNGYKWLLLYHANRDLIYDPNIIYPYMVLIIPRFEEYEKTPTKK